MAYVFTAMALISMFGFNIFAIVSAVQGNENWFTMCLVSLIDWLFIYNVFIKKQKSRQANNAIAEQTKELNDYTDEFGMIEWDDKDK